MQIELKPVHYRWQRIRQSWKEVSRPHYSPEYQGDGERSMNYRYYR